VTLEAAVLDKELLAVFGRGRRGIRLAKQQARSNSRQHKTIPDRTHDSTLQRG
jgi:hypothetical protein